MSAILNPPIECIHRKTDRRRLNNSDPYDITSFGYCRWLTEVKPRTDNLIAPVHKGPATEERDYVVTWKGRTRFCKRLENNLKQTKRKRKQ
jgi:hypothetical protein